MYTACLNELFLHELPVFHIRFKEKHKISLYKTSAIDPKRADQASEEIAQAFEDLITLAITKMHEMNPEEFPWKSLSEVPDCCLYNMDEVGENGDHKRSKKLASSALETKNWMRVLGDMKGPEPDTIKRMFEVRLGDNGDGLDHRTLVITTCGNGMFSCNFQGKTIEGACAPVLIHATPSNAKKAKEGEVPAVTSRMTEGIYASNATDPQPHGIKVL